MDVRRKNNKGLFYTVAATILIIPLILLVSFYVSNQNTEVDDKIERIRCDELHYFVQDIREDLKRAMTIFGRRAIIYTIDDVVATGVTLENYEFNCTTGGILDCNTFIAPQHGVEAAIAELAVFGTLHGENVSFMVNHTLTQWLGRIHSQGARMHFNLSLDVVEIKVVPKDSWTFAILTNASYSVVDEQGVCYYDGQHLRTDSFTSIIGLEDPLYPLNTESFVIKYIENCSIDLDSTTVSGCSVQDLGEGNATGRAMLSTELKDIYGNAALKTFCVDRTPEEVNDLILVLDTAFGGCNQIDPCCLNITCPSHMAGVIDYQKVSPQSFIDKCETTIPWIMGTGDMDNESLTGPPFSNQPGWDRPPECAESDFFMGECISIVNDPDCNDHLVLLGKDWSNHSIQCYQTSNASYYGGWDGASFFDRLEGRVNLSDYFRNQAIEYFNNSFIGLETIVNPNDFETHFVKVNELASWVGYMYWQNRTGCDVQGICSNLGYKLKLDDEHAPVFRVDTECASGRTCVSGLETCPNCADEDGDGDPDYLDTDCIGFYPECGTVVLCDAADNDDCPDCYDVPPEIWDENTNKTCDHYGYGTTEEWHFYQIIPSANGRLNITFNGTAIVGIESDKSDLIIYDLNSTGCTNPIQEFILEPESSYDFCVNAGETWVIGIDVDIPVCGMNQAYTLTNELIPDPSCGAVTTTSTSTTTTTSSSSSSSSSSIECGIFDDMESGVGGWTHSATEGTDEWDLGNPQTFKCLGGGGNCWGTDLVNPGGWYYEADTNQSLYTENLNLTSMNNPRLIFYTKYEILDDDVTFFHKDTGYVEISTDGFTWIPLDQWSKISDWTEKSYDISGYISETTQIRFRLESDDEQQDIGLYIDDFNISCTY